jgi:hypothetical protein
MKFFEGDAAGAVDARSNIMKAGLWNAANLIEPPRDGSSYLLMARIDVDGERRWPVVGHWNSVEEWQVSAGGLKLVDISYWMAIPEIPTSAKKPYPEEADE